MSFNEDLKFILSMGADMKDVQKALDDVGKKAEKALSPMEIAVAKIATGMRQAAEEAKSVAHSAKLWELDLELQRRQSSQDANQRNRGIAFGAIQQIGSAGMSGRGSGSAAIGIGKDVLGVAEAGLSGDVGGMVRSGINVITGSIEAPFKVLAQNAQNAARALGELEGPLGAVGAGYEKNAQALEYIPLIGEHLAASERASKQMAETNLRFMQKLNPMFGELLQQTNDDLMALKANSGEARKVLDTNRHIADTIATQQKHGDLSIAEMEKKLGLKAGENWWGWSSGEGMSRKETQEMNRRLEFQRQLEAGKREFESTKILGYDAFGNPKYGTQTVSADEKHREIYGYGIEKGASFGAAARPARFSSIMDYEREMQQKAFSLGKDDPQKSMDKTLKDIAEMLKAGLEELDKNVPPSGGMRDIWNSIRDRLDGGRPSGGGDF